MTGWLLPTLSLAAAFLLTGVIRRAALRTSLLDIPNQRSSHTVPTPRGGGGAIVVSFLAVVAALTQLLPAGNSAFLFLLFFTSLPVALIGLWDDVRPLPARHRILVHFLAALLLVFGLAHDGFIGQRSTFWLLTGGLVLVLTVVWALNLFNFMDGIDGLAGGEAAFVAGGGALLLSLRGGGLEMFLLLPLAAACLGFLVWNWPPARIFMGDVGSGFLGFVLAALALRTSIVRDDLSPWCWLVLGGVFLTDATITLLRRMVRRERWYDAHRSHAYQRAALRYGSHRKVTVAVMAINLFWLLPLSVLCVILPGFEALLALVAYLPLLALAVRLGAGSDKTPDNKQLDAVVCS